MESAGERGPVAARLLARHGEPATRLVANPRRLALCAAHGDEAALALIRHGDLAEPLVARLGRPAARALAALGPRQARRLAILADSGDLARIGRTPELLAVVTRFGDRAMAFVWDHKGRWPSRLCWRRSWPTRGPSSTGPRLWPVPSPGRWPRCPAESPPSWRVVSTGGSSPCAARTLIAVAVVLRRPRRPRP